MKKTISLNGVWKCKSATSDRGGMGDWPHEQKWMPDYDYTVPGSIQEAMQFVTGDVHYGHNVYNARFIEEQYWLCSRTFCLDGEDLSGENRVRAVFEGLDLCADVYVNGTFAGSHANFYTPFKPDITALVHPGENRLDVRIESGIFHYMGKDISRGYACETARQLRRLYMRKPQSAFEWDWSPRLLNVGIFRPCYLEIAPFFADEFSVFHTLNDDDSEAEIRIRQFVTVPGEKTVTIKASLAGTEAGGEVTQRVSGKAYLPLSFKLAEPRLWQPLGHGEPYRYTLHIAVLDAETGAVVSETERKLGLRRVEIDQSPRPAGGNYFRLLINGNRVFLKGGNMIPADILFSKLDRAAYETLIDRALEDNFNALRVWGGGIYESDDFYDLCDEHGIVVWQDCVAACGNYPASDEEFFGNYTDEIRYEIRRLSLYASLVILCGNNEIDQFCTYLPQNNFIDAGLYYYTIPTLLYKEGDNHYYQPSSPCSPNGVPATDFSVGDQHPWDIGFSNREYFGYRSYDCRFPNEGGILGPTSLPNMMAALGDGMDFMHSFDFKVHDNSICDRNASAPEQLLSEKLGIDVARFGMSIPDYVYYGGFLQGEGLTEYALNFRRRMNDTTGSAIFWMFNDCWPATRSWTTVDWLRNRTPAFWAVKRSFAPVAVDIVKTADGYEIYGVNDTLRSLPAHLTVGFARADGSALSVTESDVILPENNSAVLARFPLGEEGLIPFAELSADGFPLARRRFVEQAYHTLGLIPSEIRVTFDGDTATYVSDRFVFGVCLDLDGDDGALSDNFFDLYPGRPYTVRMGGKSGEILYCYPAGKQERGVKG